MLRCAPTRRFGEPLFGIRAASLTESTKSTEDFEKTDSTRIPIQPRKPRIPTEPIEWKRGPRCRLLAY